MTATPHKRSASQISLLGFSLLGNGLGYLPILLCKSQTSEPIATLNMTLQNRSISYRPLSRLQPSPSPTFCLFGTNNRSLVTL